MALIPNLVRPADDRILAGVCSGIARYLKVDVTLVRVVVALAVLVGGVSLWIYPLLWLLMPEEGNDRAGIDTLITQAKDWSQQNRERTVQARPGAEPQDVFDPYQEPRA